MDDFFVKPERKQIRELNLVPVIDMFTTVIFFLILSTSFFAFTKLTVPPAKVSVNTDPLTPPPMSTKLVLGTSSAAGQDGNVRLLLSWVGESPGQESRSIAREKVEAEVRLLAEEFKKKFPRERTVQLGLVPGLGYQVLIHAMDGVRDQLPDLVLISPEEAAARLAGRPEVGSP